MSCGAGDSEVDQIREVVVADEDVGRFHVAMYQVDLVCSMQGFGHLLDDPDRARRLDGPSLQDAVQVLALDQTHRHEQPTVDLAEVEDRHDVGFVECGR